MIGVSVSDWDRHESESLLLLQTATNQRDFCTDIISSPTHPQLEDIVLVNSIDVEKPTDIFSRSFAKDIYLYRISFTANN